MGALTLDLRRTGTPPFLWLCARLRAPDSSPWSPRIDIKVDTGSNLTVFPRALLNEKSGFLFFKPILQDGSVDKARTAGGAVEFDWTLGHLALDGECGRIFDSAPLHPHGLRLNRFLSGDLGHAILGMDVIHLLGELHYRRTPPLARLAFDPEPRRTRRAPDTFS